MNSAVLSLLTLMPLVGAIVTLGVGRNPTLARRAAATISILILARIILLWMRFDNTSASIQFEERHHWIAALHIDYRVGIDGIGLLMLLLTAIVIPIGIAASWHIRERASLYFALVFLLQSCMFGTFTALNFFHFFLFWELSLVPAFFLIRLWGGGRAGRAATQFLVYTMVGSVAMLLTFLAIYLTTGTFDFSELAVLARGNQLIPAVVTKLNWHAITPEHAAALLFAGAFLGFAVKVPLVPFHTWLPATYSEAPTGTTAILTGAMSKMGVYGFLRILIPIFAPQIREFLTPLLWLAVASIVMSAFAALAQRDLKRLFAYSSINHLGYCLLAAFAVASSANASQTGEKYAALSGALLQVFNHAITASAIFWLIALLELRSDGARRLEEFGGLRRIAPIFAGLMGIVLFSSLGLPGLNGFIGEFLIFKGTFPLTTRATVISVIGLLITAVFILGVIQRVFAGPLHPERANVVDLSVGERFALAPVIVLMFLIGLYPQVLLSSLNTTIINYVQQLGF